MCFGTWPCMSPVFITIITILTILDILTTLTILTILIYSLYSHYSVISIIIILAIIDSVAITAIFAIFTIPSIFQMFSQFFRTYLTTMLSLFSIFWSFNFSLFAVLVLNLSFRTTAAAGGNNLDFIVSVTVEPNKYYRPIELGNKPFSRGYRFEDQAKEKEEKGKTKSTNPTTTSQTGNRPNKWVIDVPLNKASQAPQYNSIPSSNVPPKQYM